MSARLVPRTSRVEAAILLPESGTFVLGRDPECDLTLVDVSTSRAHAIFERDARGWTVRDSGSANGTFVDGKRISERRLVGGETIRFGATEEFRFLGVAPRGGVGEAWRSFFTLALVPRDPSIFSRTISLSTGASIVGRDTTCDHSIPVGRVSGVQARIEAEGGTAKVVDHRSTNGTWVNGVRVHEASIRPGDEIAFGDVLFDVVSSKKPSHRGTMFLASAAAVVGIAALGFALLPEKSKEVRLWTKEMYLEQVSTSLVEAIRAYDARPPAKEIARARFEIAIRSLAAADELPPSGWSQEELAVALREASAPLARTLQGRDILRLYESSSEKPAESQGASTSAMALPGGMELPGAPPPSSELRPPESPGGSSILPPSGQQSPIRSGPAPAASPALIRAELAAIVAEFGIDAGEQPIPPTLLAEVERFVRWWTTENRKYTERSMVRARDHLGTIRVELRKNLLPEVFCYLPFIESGYQEEIGSHAGAIGMWQFMPATARKYGLVVDGTVDQRTDPERSTEAACRYINDLLATFGANAFDCAVAAYNKGEYGMVSCLRGVSWRSTWKFWDAAERGDGCLKKETIEYVPRFLAAAIVMRRPESFGFEPSGS